MNESSIKTGTTTVGIIAKDAVVLAADMQATLGHLGYEKEAKKIYKITDNIAVTNAGSVGDSLTIIRFLRARAKLYESDNGRAITAKALATLLSNVLNANRYMPFIAQFIIGGVNGKTELFEVTPYGDLIERNNFATTGSGTQLALSTLDNEYEKSISKEKAIELAVKAVNSSRKRDIYTGGKSISVWVITEKGLEELNENKIEKYLKKFSPDNK